MNKLLLLMTLIGVIAHQPDGKRIFQSTPPSPQFFPNKVGNHWLYKFSGYGTTGGKKNHISIDIIRSITLPDGQTANLWLYKFPNGIKTYLVQSNEKEVKIYEASNDTSVSKLTEFPPLKFKYLFPLTIKSKWVLGEDHGDTIKVVGVSTVTVPAGKFQHSWLLINLPDQTVHIGNSKRIDSTWFQPFTGVVRFVQQDFVLGQSLGNGLWELESFNLKK